MFYSTKSICWVTLFLLLLLFSSAAAAEQTLRVGIYQNPPKIYLDEQNQPMGLYPELLGHIAQHEGWTLEYVPCAWADCLDMVEQGELDLMPDVAWTEERSERFDFNKEPVLSSWSRIYAKEDGLIRSILDLDGKSVAVLKGSFQARRLVEEARAFDVDINLVDAKHFSHVFEMIEQGLVDAGIVNRFIGAQQKANYKIFETDINLFPARLHFAAPRAKNGNLLTRIDAQLTSLKHTPDSIYHRAIAPLFSRAEPVFKPEIFLSDEERAWIKVHPVLRTGVDHYPPYEIVDGKGGYEGLGAEYLNRISQRTGLQFEILTGLSWAQLQEGAAKGEVDVISVITKTPERSKYLRFTESHLLHPQVVITRLDHPAVTGIADLKGKTMAVSEGYSEIEDLNRDFPSIKQVVVKNPLEELKLLASGQVDAVQGNLAITGYYIRKHNLANLKVAGPSEIGGGEGMGIGSRKDWPILNSILQKGLDSISELERISISRKWIPDMVTEDEITAPIRLTEKEKEWLAEHPTIRLGFNPHMEPLLIRKEDGSLEGIYPAIFAELEERLDIDIDIEVGDWLPIVQKARDGATHGLLACAPPQAKASNLKQTETIHMAYPIAYTHHNADFAIRHLDDLQGKRIAYQREVKMLEVVLNEYQDSSELIPVNSTLEAIGLVLAGKADIAFAVNFENYLVAKHALTGVKLAYYDFSHEAAISSCIREDSPELVSILNKGLANIGTARIQKILSEWTNLPEQIHTLTLTTEERVWLADHPVIPVLLDPHWAPVEFRGDEGDYQGISMDYLKQLESMLGIRFEVAEFSSWGEGVEQLRNKQLGMATSMVRTEERDKFALFSEPYIDMPVNIFASDEVSYIGSLNNLHGKRVAVVKGYAVTEWLKRDYPQIEHVVVSSTADALKMVSSGEVDAYVGNVVVASYYLGILRLPNVRIAGETPYSYSQSMAVRNDWPMFAGILQKALSAIEQPEREAIYNRWMSIEYEHRIDYTLLWQLAAVIITGFGIFTVWNLSLKRTVAHRTVELQQSEESLQRAQKVASVGSWHLDIPSNVLTWSDETYRMFGVPKGTPLTYDTFIGCVHPEDRNHVNKTWTAALTGAPYDIEHRIVVNGDTRWVNEKVELEFNEQGEALRGMGTVQDITEHKRIEQSLFFTAQRGWNVTNEDFFQSLVIFLAESFGVQYAFIDKLTENDTAYTVALYAGGKIIENIEYPLKYTPCENVMGKKMCSYPRDIQQIFPKDELLVQMDAESYVGLPLWNSAGEPIGLIAIMDTKPLREVKLVESVLQVVANRAAAELERKSTDEKLNNYRDHLEELVEERTQELSEANIRLKELDNLKSMFIASMSHELRTPLNSIIGFTGVLLQGVTGDLNTKQRDSLERVQRAGRHLLSLISDVIDISKIEAGRIEIYKEKFSLKDLLQEAVDNVGPQAEAKGLELKVDGGEELILYTDRQRLLQCLVNYLSNAVKFTEKGSVTLHVRADGEEIDFSVEDTGIGIAEEDKARLFEAFERLESHLRIKAGGTGLGLYLTKKIVTELLAGSIYLQSTLGEGSVFGLRIPRTLPGRNNHYEE
ncbi:MAG: transporter substrate-binding domain-containing protein [Sedimenticola sp.]